MVHSMMMQMIERVPRWFRFRVLLEDGVRVVVKRVLKGMKSGVKVLVEGWKSLEFRE